MSEILEEKELLGEELESNKRKLSLVNNELLPDDKGPNREILDTIDYISEDVIKILIPEDYIISKIIYNILEKLSIKNKSIRLILVQVITKYINNKTEFYYDKYTKEVIGLALESYKLKELFEELIIFKVEDKYFQENSEINKSRIEKKEEIDKNGININEFNEKLNELNQRLFQLHSRSARLEDKGEIDENLNDNIIFIETDLSVLLINKEELVLNKIKLESTIKEIDKSLKILEEYKEHEIKEKINNIDNKFIKFSFSYKLKEKKGKKDKIGNEKSFELGKKAKNIIYLSTFLASMGFFIKGINDINENINIIDNFQESLNIQNKVPNIILKEVSKGSPHIVSGFEEVFIIGTDTYPLDVPYKGETLDKDIILNKIKITFVDKNGDVQTPKIIETYFYRKDIKNKDGFTIIIKDNSEDIRKINLKFKDKNKNKK